jgi:hypothetical protein
VRGWIGDVCHHVGGTAGQPGCLEVTDRPRQHLPPRAAKGQDRGPAAEDLSDHLTVTVGDGHALGQGLLDRLAHTVALAGHPRSGSDTHEVRHHAQLFNQAQDQCFGRGRPEPGTGDQRDRVGACLLVAVKQSPDRRPFVRDVHVGQLGGEAGVDHRTGLPGERPDRGQDHTDAGDRLGQRRRLADVDGTHVRRRAIGGQRSSEVLQWAAAASSQPDRQAAGGQLGRDEPPAVPRRPKQEHVAGRLTVTTGLIGSGPLGAAPGSSCIGWQAEPDLCEQLPEPLGVFEVGHVCGMLEPHELFAWCL